MILYISIVKRLRDDSKNKKKIKKMSFKNKINILKLGEFINLSIQMLSMLLKDLSLFDISVTSRGHLMSIFLYYSNLKNLYIFE